MLPDHPAALAGLAAAAETPEARGKVWLLERELPFVWAAVPLELWITAFDVRRKSLKRLLVSNHFPDTAASSLADSTVIAAADALAGLEPMLRAALSLTVGTTLSADTVPALKEGVQGRLWPRYQCRSAAAHVSRVLLPTPWFRARRATPRLLVPRQLQRGTRCTLRSRIGGCVAME
jgi:hypothetical protein